MGLRISQCSSGCDGREPAGKDFASFFPTSQADSDVAQKYVRLAHQTHFEGRRMDDQPHCWFMWAGIGQNPKSIHNVPQDHHAPIAVLDVQFSKKDWPLHIIGSCHHLDKAQKDIPQHFCHAFSWHDISVFFLTERWMILPKCT